MSYSLTAPQEFRLPDLSLRASQTAEPTTAYVERPFILYVGEEIPKRILGMESRECDLVDVTAAALVFLMQNWAKLDLKMPEAVFVSEKHLSKLLSESFPEVRSRGPLKNVPLIVFAEKEDEIIKNVVLSIEADDYFCRPVGLSVLNERIKFCNDLNALGISMQNATFQENEDSIQLYSLKRLFDVIVSGTTLLLLSPIMVLIAIIIKLESRGPIFYTSKRAGSNYKVFDFYKFRSMRKDADTELEKLKETSNQYKDAKQQFVKIANDPRITRFGNLLRNTSLDELPQLLNVLKGDMSIVGNRPLPLYEAEQLTTDNDSERFLGPAGITGLWQTLKRGKSEMSAEERIILDRIYARKNSFWMDLKIVLLTVPALLQSEKV